MFFSMSVSTINVYCYYKNLLCNCLNISEKQNKIIRQNIFKNNLEIIIVIYLITVFYSINIKRKAIYNFHLSALIIIT